MDQLAGLAEEARKLALDRFRQLQPHLEGDRPLKAVAAAAGIPFRTAQRWVSLYRQFGLTALSRKKRADTGRHREMSAKLREAIEGIALLSNCTQLVDTIMCCFNSLHTARNL